MKLIAGVAFVLLTASASNAAIALVTTGSAYTNNTSASTTTAAMNCTGADLLVVSVVGYSNSLITGASVTDSVGGNTWTSLPEYTPAAGRHQAFYYSANASVGSAMTITFTSSSSDYLTLLAACYSGVATSSPKDQSTGTNGVSGTTCQPGSVTPGQNNELLVTGIHTHSLFVSIDSSFTREISQPAGANENSFLGDLIQGTAAATNPKWTLDATDTSPCSIATFKPTAAAAGGGSNKRMRMEREEE